MNKKEKLIDEINFLNVKKENLNEQEKKELKRLKQNLRMIIIREDPEYRKKESQANVKRQTIRIKKQKIELEKFKKLTEILKQKEI
jgi:hypothetical protein